MHRCTSPGTRLPRRPRLSLYHEHPERVAGVRDWGAPCLLC
jgi:hypothetical protein